MASWRSGWSPDDGQTAFNRSTFVCDDPVLQQTGTGCSSIWIINSDGTNPRRLTTCSGYESSPSWSRYGQSIRFYSDRDGEGSSAWTCRVDGGELEPAEEWGVSPDGTRLLFLNDLSMGDSTHMDRLWVLDLGLDQWPA